MCENFFTKFYFVPSLSACKTFIKEGQWDVYKKIKMYKIIKSIQIIGEKAVSFPNENMHECNKYWLHNMRKGDSDLLSHPLKYNQCIQSHSVVVVEGVFVCFS